MRPSALLFLSLLVPSAAHAWEYRCRFAERIGSTDFPLVNNTIDASSTAPRRIRFQFGVFDDDAAPAPSGGFIGWNVGTMSASGPVDNSDDRRTPGQLSPFNFSEDHSQPPPQTDPFTLVQNIAATLGTQSPNWLCNPDGTPSPQTPATVRGLNSYASIYEITIDPRPAAQSYMITISGNLIAATERRTVGTPIPPNCGDPAIPDDDVPGSLTYAPFPTPPRSFECALTVRVPAPPAALVAALGLFALRRRRRSAQSEIAP